MKLLRILLTIIILLALIIAYGNYHFRYSMNTLPRGNFIKESTAPNGEYTVRVYVSSPALSSDSVRCEVVNNGNGKVRNIFWGYRLSDVSVLWLNNDLVMINGRLINIRTGHYDYREEAREQARNDAIRIGER